jgi:hypothetical protein
MIKIGRSSPRGACQGDDGALWKGSRGRGQGTRTHDPVFGPPSDRPCIGGYGAVGDGSRGHPAVKGPEVLGRDREPRAGTNTATHDLLVSGPAWKHAARPWRGAGVTAGQLCRRVPVLSLLCGVVALVRVSSPAAVSVQKCRTLMLRTTARIMARPSACCFSPKATALSRCQNWPTATVSSPTSSSTV